MIAQILFIKRQEWNVDNSVCLGEYLNIWKADFHSLIKFKWSEKEDIVLVENDIIHSVTSIPTIATSFLDHVVKFDERKSGLSVMESC